MRLKLVFNPTAGRGRARRHIAEATRYLTSHGAEVELAASASPADLTRIVAESSGYDRVVVCGGDGTLNLAVRELDLANTTLALLPLGSGDDFARVAGIPRKLIEACKVVLNGRVREVDVALANDIRYLGVAGLGFDSEVAAYANRVKYLRGSLIYLWSILRVLPRFEPRPVRIRTSNGVRDEQIMFAVVGNTQQYGGGIRIAPSAEIDDGLLDLYIIHRTSRVQLLKTLPRAYNGSHVTSPFVESARGHEFHFESERPLEVYADGERITETPVTFKLAEQKLRIVVP